MKRILPFILSTLVLACSGEVPLEAEPGSSDETPVDMESDGRVHESAYQVYSYCTSIPVVSCPTGYTVLSADCTSYCSRLGYSCNFGGINEVFCLPPPNGTVTANPTLVRINLDVTYTGTTQICWNVNNIAEGAVWVSMDGQPETLFAGGNMNGCASAPWILSGSTYQFRLYAGTAHTNLLNTVTVVGEGYHGGNNPPPLCGPCNPGLSCHCGDRCRPTGSACP